MRMRIVLAVTAGLVTGALATAGTAAAAPAGGTGTAAVAAPAGAAGYGSHHCYSSELAAGFHGEQAGLGNRGFLLTLTNISDGTCYLYGYPRLKLLAASWRALPTRTRRGPTYFDADPGRRLIVLSPGETVSADISFGVAGQPSNSVLATYMEVTPPGARHHLVLGIPGGAVLVFEGRVDVTALARHTPYSG